MKTERLYYTDPMLLAFEARVVRAEGERVVLDRTAFYPTSGGQPYDTGRIDNARVIEVLDNDEGEVIHVLDRALTAETVHGEIDAARRFDHMQQHTGQHLLSAVLVELFKYATVSFHLGEELSTIDLATPSISDLQIAKAEERANALIFEDRKVNVSFRDKEEVDALGLRKQTKREGQIRLIEISGVDLSACGGTHVRSTGEIGAIVLRRVEKVKQGTRVEFACGQRAVRWARRDFTALTRAATLYTAKPHELPDLVAKKIEESKAGERERKRLLETVAAYEAKEMHDATLPNAAGIRVVEKTFDTADPNYIRFLAAQIARQPAARAVFALRQPPILIVAQTKDLGPDLGAMVKQLGLRGGGTKDSAQAGAPDWESLERALLAISPAIRT
jgi:alanyl-tRNA synthetase